MKTSILRDAITAILFVTALSATPDGRAQDLDVDPSEETAEATEIASITVTGTRIRGGQTPSPVITINASQIKAEGFTSLGEVIRSVPQNFGGGQNPGVDAGAAAGAAGLANQNVTGGSALNLRGLGPDATLTLLNGQRMSYGGFTQGVDISAIPVEAVDRIEIVTDGASAIYGSDAVGGVGNVILKREFEGLAVGLRYGGTADGGLATRTYSATGGKAWLTGGLLASFSDTSIDPIFADQRGYTETLPESTTIYPASDAQSALLTAHQRLGDAVTLNMTAARNERKQNSYFSFLGNHVASPETAMTFVSPTVELALNNDWVILASGAWGKDEHMQIQERVGLDTGRVRTCYCNESSSYEISGEGPLFAMRGGSARLAAGVGYRSNQYEQFNHLTSSLEAKGDEDVRFAYLEASLPWIGARSASRWGNRLETTVAVRGEKNSSFGSVFSPKVGMVYSPTREFTLRTSWGRSFKAPTLLQRYYGPFHWLDMAAHYGGGDYADDATIMFSNGANPDLLPERARTWNATLAFHPETVPGLEAELTWFKIDYTDRVVEPVTDYGQALRIPAYRDFINFNPSLEEQREFIDSVPDFNNFTGRDYDPEKVVAIILGRYANAARQRVRGLDVSARYVLDLERGSLGFRGSASWLDMSQQMSRSEPMAKVSGILYSPARTSGRLGVEYSGNALSASFFGNYRSGVVNPVDGKRTSSFTTLDASLGLTAGGRGGWPELDIRLSANNMLDRAPPLHLVADSEWGRQPLPYDSTNYSAIGRFVSLSLALAW